MWKYATCFKPIRMFLASKLIKNLHAATFASMLMKSSGLLHEAVRHPFSICKHIFGIFSGWKRLFSKHTEAEQKYTILIIKEYGFLPKSCGLCIMASSLAWYLLVFLLLKLSDNSFYLYERMFFKVTWSYNN